MRPAVGESSVLDNQLGTRDNKQRARSNSSGRSVPDTAASTALDGNRVCHVLTLKRAVVPQHRRSMHSSCGQACKGNTSYKDSYSYKLHRFLCGTKHTIVTFTALNSAVKRKDDPPSTIKSAGMCHIWGWVKRCLQWLRSSLSYSLDLFVTRHSDVVSIIEPQVSVSTVLFTYVQQCTAVGEPRTSSLSRCWSSTAAFLFSFSVFFFFFPSFFPVGSRKNFEQTSTNIVRR